MEIKELEQLFGILKHSDISEFELDRNGVRVKITRGVRHAISGHANLAPVFPMVEPAIVSPTLPGTAFPDAANSSTKAPPAINPNFVKVESPIVGTFYRKPSPDAEPFAKEGDRVKKGDTLCIIEAMKLMNEIESPCDGKIEKVMLADAKVVEFGELLFLIDPAS
jgi:acetyl-CoA carboxylase biotin carboxyl carrier protein